MNGSRNIKHCIHPDRRRLLWRLFYVSRTIKQKSWVLFSVSREIKKKRCARFFLFLSRQKTNANVFLFYYSRGVKTNANRKLPDGVLFYLSRWINSYYYMCVLIFIHFDFWNWPHFYIYNVLLPYFIKL